MLFVPTLVWLLVGGVKGAESVVVDVGFVSYYVTILMTFIFQLPPVVFWQLSQNHGFSKRGVALLAPYSDMDSQ